MKKNLVKRLLPALAIAMLLVVGVSCNNKEGNAQLMFSLTDAPSLEYSAVNLDVQGISVGVGDVENVEWINLDLLHPGIYNLLDYRNGEMVVLADQSFPAGRISQVRLILGENSSVVKDGVVYPLKTPSAQQSGLKFNLHQVLEPDMMYHFVVDFDASRSVVTTGNGDHLLKPVIRTYAKHFGASYKGYVLPAEAKPYVEIIQGTDTLISLPEADGKFLFAGIEGGVWKVNVYANDELNEFRDITFSTPVLVEGVVMDAGTIVLEK